MDTELLIAGGCFTSQNNIPPENLYHQILKRKIEADGSRHLNINVIRYESFLRCLVKIKKVCERKNPDVLLFHIRSEQFLRIVKLVYSYNKNDKRKFAFNVAFLNLVPPENAELLMAHMPAPDENRRSPRGLRKLKILLNYIAGSLIANKLYALKKYDTLVSGLINFCRERKIKLIIAGPASRPYLKTENKMSEYLENYFRKKAEMEGVSFVSLLGHTNDKNESLFFTNGIHVSEAGHKRAAAVILEKLDKILSILLLSFLFRDLLICI